MKRSVLMWVGLMTFCLANTVFSTEQKIALKAADVKGAKGDAVISDLPGGQKQVKINATGLKPDSVYTLWFVNVGGNYHGKQSNFAFADKHAESHRWVSRKFGIGMWSASSVPCPVWW